MDMVEKVARLNYAVIAAAHDFNAIGFDSFDEAPADDFCKEKAYGLARAAIAAMREPTEAMVRAGRATECEHGDMNCGCAVSWQAMIDAALGED